MHGEPPRSKRAPDAPPDERAEPNPRFVPVPPRVARDLLEPSIGARMAIGFGAFGTLVGGTLLSVAIVLALQPMPGRVVDLAMKTFLGATALLANWVRALGFGQVMERRMAFALLTTTVWLAIFLWFVELEPRFTILHALVLAALIGVSDAWFAKLEGSWRWVFALASAAAAFLGALLIHLATAGTRSDLLILVASALALPILAAVQGAALMRIPTPLGEAEEDRPDEPLGEVFE